MTLVLLPLMAESLVSQIHFLLQIIHVGKVVFKSGLHVCFQLRIQVIRFMRS